MISHGKDIKIFTGNANPKLAADICKIIGTKLGESEVKSFADGEASVSLYETVRGSDVFLIQSTCKPVNDSLMELLIMVDACRRASAGRITAVMPYFGYARQDRKAKSRDPISAKLVANMLTASGADRVLTMDLHASQIQGFFDIPVDNLLGNPVFVDYYANPGRSSQGELAVICVQLLSRLITQIGCMEAVQRGRNLTDFRFHTIQINKGPLNGIHILEQFRWLITFCSVDRKRIAVIHETDRIATAYCQHMVIAGSIRVADVSIILNIAQLTRETICTEIGVSV